MHSSKVTIAIGEESVSGLLLRPADAKALYVFAHGAGAGMTHRAMELNAQGLAARGIATLRYQFPYMERGGRRPDPPKIAHAAVRAAVAEAARLAPDLPLFAGGRSFGGRMTSQAQAGCAACPKVRGLAFLGFPLHPAGKPGIERAEHLGRVETPMLFVLGQPRRARRARPAAAVVDALGSRASLHLVDQADHSFKVAAKSGRTPADAEAEALDALSEWMLRII